VIYSLPSKSQQVKEILQGLPREEITPEKIKEIAEQVGCSKALVYKHLRKLERQGHWEAKPEEALPTPKEPVIKIEEEQPIELPKPEEEKGILEKLFEEPEEKPEEEEEIPEEFIPEEAIQIEEAIPIGFDKENIEWMWKWTFEKIADFTQWDGWRLKDEEARKLAETWTPLLNQNIDPIAKYVPLINAGMTTAIIFAPRIFAYRQQQKKREEERIIPKTPQPPSEEKPEQPEKPEEEQPEKPKSQGKPPFLDKL